MTIGKKQRSIRNVLVLSGFQGRVFYFILISGLLSLIATGSLYYLYVVDSYTFVLSHSKLPAELVNDRLDQLFLFWVSLTLIGALAVFVIASWALFITHRATGPVQHLAAVIGKIRAGDVSARVLLRKKDEFQDLAHSFNSMMDEVQRR